MNKIIYPPCKKCNKSHGMGIEEMSTGKITPLDICYDCLWNLLQFHKKINPELLLELEDIKKSLKEVEEKLIGENI
jgi:hypothetical protein